MRESFCPRSRTVHATEIIFQYVYICTHVRMYARRCIYGVKMPRFRQKNLHFLDLWFNIKFQRWRSENCRDLTDTTAV